MKGKSTLQALGVVLVTSTTAMAGPITLELSPQKGTWNFDTDTAAKLPTGWSIRQTRPTKRLATWQVTTDSTAPSKPNVLALTSTENYNGTSYGDCDDGVDRTPTRIEELTARLEDLKVVAPIDGVEAEQAAEEENLRGDEEPHTELRCWAGAESLGS